MQCYHFTSVLNPKSTIVVVVGGGVVVTVTKMCLVLGLSLHLHSILAPCLSHIKMDLVCPGTVLAKFFGRKLPGNVVAECC